MKIALYHNLTSGGSKREAYEFTKQLIQKGHKVDVYTTSCSDDEFLSMRSLGCGHIVIPISLSQPIKSRLPGLKQYLNLIIMLANVNKIKASSARCAEIISQLDYDFAFLHNEAIIQAPYISTYLKIPSIYFCNEVNRGIYEYPIKRIYSLESSYIDRLQKAWYFPAEYLRKRIVQKEDFRNVRSADLLLTNSFFSAESILRVYGVRPRVVYLGVDIEKFFHFGLERKNIVLSVGAINPLKGYEFVIDAIAEIPEKLRPDFIVVGNTASYSEKEFLSTHAFNKKVNISFKVNVNEDELVILYNQAKLFIYAPHLEPFGLAPLEAMACSTPVIAIKEGGVRESVIDGVTGYLIERDTTLFSNAMVDLLSSPHKWDEFSRNSQDTIRSKWTWEHATDRLISTVSQFLNHNPEEKT